MANTSAQSPKCWFPLTGPVAHLSPAVNCNRTLDDLIYHQLTSHNQYFRFPDKLTPVTVKMASAPAEKSLLTLPVDVLKGITKSLEESDEKSLKQTCRRMSLLLAPPPAAHVLAGNNPARDGRSTPLPQSPLPESATITLRELEQENHEVEQRDAQRGMELSDTEDGFEDSRSDTGSKPTKYKGSKILNWTAQLDSAPSSPKLRSPASFLHSPRPESPRPTEVDLPTRQ